MDPDFNMLDDFYGVEQDENVPPQKPDAIQLENLHQHFQEELQLLHNHVNPLEEDGNYGIDIFLSLKALLGIT